MVHHRSGGERNIRCPQLAFLVGQIFERMNSDSSGGDDLIVPAMPWHTAVPLLGGVGSGGCST